MRIVTSLTLDGAQFWQQPQPEAATNSRVWRPPHRQGRAVNIELAAYVLQLKTERSGVTSAIPILRWVSAQRNSNGGFSSTQVSKRRFLIFLLFTFESGLLLVESSTLYLCRLKGSDYTCGSCYTLLGSVENGVPQLPQVYQFCFENY